VIIEGNCKGSPQKIEHKVEKSTFDTTKLDAPSLGLEAPLKKSTAANKSTQSRVAVDNIINRYKVYCPAFWSFQLAG
jgi:hypothetical protein